MYRYTNLIVVISIQVEVHSTVDYAIALRDERLTSVCPLTAIHPSQKMIGSANTAGVVHVWT